MATGTAQGIQFRVLGISGSLRKASFNLELLRAAQTVAPTGVEAGGDP